MAKKKQKQEPEPKSKAKPKAKAMDPSEIDISQLRSREYTQNLSAAAIIDLAELWIATGHYHAQSGGFPSSRETLDWTDFTTVSRFLGVLAETNGIDSSTIANLAERAERGIEINMPFALRSIAVVRRLISRLESNPPSDTPPDIPNLGDSEIRLILALGDGKKTQMELIADAGYSETSGTMKKALSVLVQRDILGNGGPRDPGYFLQSAYSHLPDHLKKTHPDLLQLIGRKSH